MADATASRRDGGGRGMVRSIMLATTMRRDRGLGRRLSAARAGERQGSDLTRLMLGFVQK